MTESVKVDSLHAALVRVVTCVGCKGEHLLGEWDTPGLRWHGHCLTCGLWFWHDH